MEFVKCLVCGAPVEVGEDTICTICGCDPTKEKAVELVKKIVDSSGDSYHHSTNGIDYSYVPKELIVLAKRFIDKEAAEGADDAGGSNHANE